MTADDHNGQERDAEQRMCNLRHRSLEDSLAELKRQCELRWAQEEKAMQARWTGLERRFIESDERVREAKAIVDRAAERAEMLATQRTAAQNEWRQTVNDIMATMVPRTEYVVQHQILAEKAETNAKNIDREMSAMRERGNSNRIQTIILTGLMTAVFTMLVYLVILHVR